MNIFSRSLLPFLLVLSCGLSLSAQEPDSGQATQVADNKAPKKPKNKKPFDPLENMKFRNLGPAVGGGRVSAVVGIPGKPNVYYAGAAGGGVFMTQDGGLSWKPIFEKESTVSIGAIALAPSNPNLVWIGTGESNPRNDVITGKGVYFSPDAGATWKFMGLRDAGQISNIVIDPHDPKGKEINFVFVLGRDDQLAEIESPGIHVVVVADHLPVVAKIVGVPQHALF